jgi:hypothetical protein
LGRVYRPEWVHFNRANPGNPTGDSPGNIRTRALLGDRWARSSTRGPSPDCPVCETRWPDENCWSEGNRQPGTRTAASGHECARASSWWTLRSREKETPVPSSCGMYGGHYVYEA